MKKNNALFITLTATSVMLILTIMTDNIISVPGQCPRLEAVIESLDPRDSQATTEAVRQKFIRMKLPLHEGNYWKRSYE